MIYLVALGLMAATYFVYQRYMPVRGIKQMTPQEVAASREENVQLLDIRDYQTSNRDFIIDAHCLPLPYLKRHYHEIPNKRIILIGTDLVEKNLAARFLKGKGIEVTGYCLCLSNDCKEEGYSYEI
ncbi:hypothetical protein GLW20_18250 [Virgibacillus halodenitrificans]|nr:hypothetical protein [Virgibacillus halodenitrificans]